MRFTFIAVLMLMTGSVAKAAKQLPLNFSLDDFGQKQHKINRDEFSREGLVLQFWAPWCHSCSTVIWDLDPILKKFQKVQFASINIDEDFSLASKYILKHRLYESYKNSFYTNPSDNLLKALEVTAVPVVFVIDRKGRVIHEARSHIDTKASISILKALKSISSKGAY